MSEPQLFVTVFAFLGTWIVAKYAFRQHSDGSDAAPRQEVTREWQRFPLSNGMSARAAASRAGR